MTAASDAFDLDGIRAGYHGTVAIAVERLTLAAGTVTAVIGANGAGKSTLLRLLALQELPAAGCVRVFGEEARTGNLTRLRRCIGLLPQNPYLLRGTVNDNVELGLRLRGCSRGDRAARVARALALLGLTPLAGRNVRRLSGGEVQKVALARVLVFDPPVLVLDEPFTHLDAAVAREIAALIATIGATRRQTIVFSTHDAAHAGALASRVLTVVDGTVAEPS